MGLRYVCANNISASGPVVPLRRPNLTTLKNTRGDGNCMFRALSYLITGTQAQHLGVRAAIVRHLLQHDDLFMCSAQVGVNSNYNSLSEYTLTNAKHNMSATPKEHVNKDYLNTLLTKEAQYTNILKKTITREEELQCIS